MTGTECKTLVIGFDALDFRYLDQFADVLPNFRRFRERGGEATLESTFPPWTGSAWPSMYTGTDPSYHGVYDFFDIDGYPDDASLVSRYEVKQPALWEYLTAEDVRSVVLNVPVTHPAAEIDGVLVPGYLAPDDAAGYPETIREELAEAIGEPYRIYARNEGTGGTKRVSDYVDLIDLRRRAAVYLLESNDWAFSFLQVQKTDSVFHSFDDESAFRRVYEAADEFLGAVLDAVGDDANVIICSDHGMGPNTGYSIYPNELLRDHGYLETGQSGTGPQLKHVKPELKDSESGEASDRGVASAALTSIVEQFGSHLPVGTLSAITDRLGMTDQVRAMVSPSAIASTSDGIDWGASTAYCQSGPRLGIRLNVEGREPDGVVPEDRYDHVRDAIIGLLREIETPDGRDAFEDVAPREAVYDGPYTEAADDILVTPCEMDNNLGTELFGRAFAPLDTHNHKQSGVFLASGPAFETGAVPDRLSLTDVAPIAMATLGQPVPDRMTGTVPDGVVDGPVETAAYDDVVAGGSADFEKRHDGEMEDRLRNLGYL